MKLTPEEGAQRAHRFGQHQVQRYGAASMEDWWRWRLKVSIWERDDRPGVLTRELFPWGRLGFRTQDIVRFRRLFDPVRLRLRLGRFTVVNQTNTDT